MRTDTVTLMASEFYARKNYCIDKDTVINIDGTIYYLYNAKIIAALYGGLADPLRAITLNIFNNGRSISVKKRINAILIAFTKGKMKLIQEKHEWFVVKNGEKTKFTGIIVLTV